MTDHFVDSHGNYIGGFGDGAIPPDGSIKVEIAPPHGRCQWDGEKWLDPVFTKEELLKMEYENNGITLQDRIAALEEMIFDKKNEKGDAIKAIREKIK